jgi:hypothetical protein
MTYGRITSRAGSRSWTLVWWSWLLRRANRASPRRDFPYRGSLMYKSNTWFSRMPPARRPRGRGESVQRQIILARNELETHGEALRTRTPIQSGRVSLLVLYGYGRPRANSGLPSSDRCQNTSYHAATLTSPPDPSPSSIGRRLWDATVELSSWLEHGCGTARPESHALCAIWFDKRSWYLCPACALAKSVRCNRRFIMDRTRLPSTGPGPGSPVGMQGGRRSSGRRRDGRRTVVDSSTAAPAAREQTAMGATPIWTCIMIPW